MSAHAESGGAGAASEGPVEKFLANEYGKPWKEAPSNVVHGVAGGVYDTTVGTLTTTTSHLVGDVIKPLVDAPVNLIGRTGEGIIDTVKLHPLRGATKIAVGAANAVENLVDAGKGVVETLGDAVTGITYGVARTIGGVLGEDVLGPEYKARMKTLLSNWGLQEVNPPYTPAYAKGGSAASSAGGDHHAAGH